ncbi:hypothetical protein Tco_1484913 [Tanacetum coccineum]
MPQPPRLTPKVLQLPSCPPTHQGLALAPKAWRRTSLVQVSNGPELGCPAGRAKDAQCRSTPYGAPATTIDETTISNGKSQHPRAFGPRTNPDRSRARGRHWAPIQSGGGTPLKPVFIFSLAILVCYRLHAIFSLGRNFPPYWGSIPKQPDADSAHGATGSRHDGDLTLLRRPVPGDLAWSVAGTLLQNYNSDCKERPIFQAGPVPGFARRYLGILVSFLFPPNIDSLNSR